MTSLRESDLIALRALVDLYAAKVDDGDAHGASRLFLSDGVLAAAAPPADLGPVTEHRGHDEIAAAFGALDGFTATFHAVHGVVFEADMASGQATGRVTATAHHFSVRDSTPRDLIWQVVYRDRYTKTDEGWRFARREVHITSVSTAPAAAVSDSRGGTASDR